MAGKQSGPFVIVYGGEDFYLDRAVQAGRSQKNRVVHFVDGDGMTDKDFVELCESRSFDGSDRAVVIDNANKLKGKAALKEFIEKTDSQDLSTLIVAIVRAPKLPEAWKAATTKGKVKHYPKFKPWEAKKVKAAILKEASRLKLELEEDAVNAFLILIGEDLRLIVNELQKLVHIVGAGGVVERHHVPLVVGHSKTATPYEVVEAAVGRNPRKAMSLLSLLFKTNGEGASVPLTYSLINMVEKLIVARQMLDTGDTADIIATRFDMHRYRAEKHLLPLARKHTVKELREHMKRLCKLDIHVKGSAPSKRTLVELAVLSIAA